MTINPGINGGIFDLTQETPETLIGKIRLISKTDNISMFDVLMNIVDVCEHIDIIDIIEFLDEPMRDIIRVNLLATSNIKTKHRTFLK